VLSTDPIRPLHDVWLRPRRVFRELASQPIGRIDYLLGAVQGIVGILAYSRARNAGATSSVAEIFGKALLFGSCTGIALLFLMSTIYSRLGARAAGTPRRTPVFHVLAYGEVPMLAALVVWFLTALLAGEQTFELAGPDVETFVALLLHAQFAAYMALTIWSVVLQVMGLSEIYGLATRKAFGLWVLGQLIGFLAMIFLTILIATLFPSILIS
jgi:hypothetical protein